MNDTTREPQGCSETPKGFTLPTDQTLDYVHRSRLVAAEQVLEAQETRHTNEIEALRALVKDANVKEINLARHNATLIAENSALTTSLESARETVRALTEELDNEKARHNRSAELYRKSETERERQREQFTATIDSLTALGQSLEEQMRALKAQPTMTPPPFKPGYKVFYVDYEAGSVLRAKVLRSIMEWEGDATTPDVRYRVRFDRNGEVTNVHANDLFGLLDEAVATLKGGV